MCTHMHTAMLPLLLAFFSSTCTCTLAYQTPPNELKLLVLVPWPSDRDDAGWDAGLDLLTGGRVAVNEINNTTDLLKDYHIELPVPEYGHEACALRETSQGLVNFVQYSMYPPGQILAVLGLYCSTSTKEISSLAGHKSVQLIQLSAANSPIFDSEINKTFSDDVIRQSGYPHLWRFLVSASVYADMIIELVNMYNWNDIVLLYTTDSNFYVGIGEALSNQLSDNILLSLTTEVQFHDKTLDRIRNEGGRIIFVAANSMETASLLCRAAERGMLYPDYMWIITDYVLSFLESANQCDNALLHHALNGSLLSYFSLEPHNKIMKLINGDTYSSYKSEYYKELDIVAEEYNQTLSGDHQYAGLLYDQVWACALALNNSLPELSRRNLSVSDIGSLGYSEAKEILEKELSQLDFRGASGRIRFNNKREVSTPIDIYQVINGQQELVGNCIVDNSSVVLYCNITLIETPPSSNFDKVYASLSLAIAVPLFVIAIIVLLSVTGILLLFLYNRNQPEIKAYSWNLTLLQFLACYILCITMIYSIVQSIFPHVAYCYIFLPFLFNGIFLILITMFLKILRVYRLFNNKSLKRLGWRCSNSFLIFCSIGITIISSTFFIISYPLSLTEDSVLVIPDNGMRYLKVHQRCVPRNSNAKLDISIGTFIVLLPAFLTTVTVIFAWKTRKIHKNFKDTKKVNIHAAVTFVLSMLIAGIFIINGNGIYFYIIIYIDSLGHILFCLSILFLPKLWWMSRYCHKFHYLMLLSHK